MIAVRHTNMIRSQTLYTLRCIRDLTLFGLLNASVKRKTCLPIAVKNCVQSKLSFTPYTLITKTEHVPIAPKLASAVLPKQSSSFFNFYRKSSISVSSSPSTILSSSTIISSPSAINKINNTIPVELPSSLPAVCDTTDVAYLL